MEKHEKRILLALSAVVLCLLAAVLTLRSRQPEVIAGTFVPPAFDAAAVSGVPEGVDETMYGTLTLNEHAAVSLYSSPILYAGEAEVYFTVEEGSDAWVRLQLLGSDGTLLGETGLLRGGEYVARIPLSVQPESGPALAKILTYEPETYYSLGSATAQIMLQVK